MFAICLESSHARGMGHLFRGLTLAKALRSLDCKVVFVLNEHPPAIERIRQSGFFAEVAGLTDWVSRWEQPIALKHRVTHWINDRLHTAPEHTRTLRALGVKVVTFDDQGGGASGADLHICAFAAASDPVPGRRVLRGWTHLVLNPEIARFRRSRKDCASMVVSLGGSDTYGVTIKVVAELLRTGKKATVVLGPGFQHEGELYRLASPLIEIRRNVPSLVEEFSRHDLAVTGGGLTAFECAAAGLPAIVIANELFEVSNGRALHECGAARFAGYWEAMDLSVLAEDLDLQTMSAAGMAFVPTDGALRVAREIVSL